jgi:hypothetical protein
MRFGADVGDICRIVRDWLDALALGADLLAVTWRPSG